VSHLMHAQHRPARLQRRELRTVATGEELGHALLVVDVGGRAVEAADGEGIVPPREPLLAGWECPRSSAVRPEPCRPAQRHAFGRCGAVGAVRPEEMAPTGTPAGETPILAPASRSIGRHHLKASRLR
jgi:hypothetical protein